MIYKYSILNFYEKLVDSAFHPQDIEWYLYMRVVFANINMALSGP